MSTAQAAAALGVSVTSVKRWVDDGILPAHRTAGGHRKLLVADLVRLVRSGDLPAADPAQLFARAGVREGPDPAALRQEFRRAVKDRDPDLLRAVIDGAYRCGLAIDRLADEVIAPVFHEVGQEWERGRLEVMAEHRVTQACLAALHELAPALRGAEGAGRPVAVGGAPEHDHHGLGSLLAQMALTDCGWEAVNLGPHTPFAALRAAVRELRPRLVWVSATCLVEPERFVAEYREFYPEAVVAGAAVAIGGSGITEAVRTQLPYACYGDGLTHLAEFARSLYRPPRRPRRGRPPGRGTGRA
jgi:excisionase family DNA binding protein